MLRTEQKDQLEKMLDLKRAENTYRSFTPLESLDFPHFKNVSGKSKVNMCSNDYLGFSQREPSRRLAIESIRKNGLGATGSRNIGGTRPVHTFLETELAELYRAEDTLIYSSGNAANNDIITCLSRYLPSTVFYSDEENHASLIEPMRALPKTRRVVFPHNDFSSLENHIKSSLSLPIQPVIVVESLYSMSGDWCPLNEIIAISKKYKCLLVVNEVHAAGIRGKEGAGRCEELDSLGDVDIIVGSFSKAYGTIGGYLAGKQSIVDLCRQTGTRSIFTTALPESLCLATLENIRYRRGSERECKILAENLVFLKRQLALENIEYLGGDASHIVPVLINDEEKTRAISQKLWNAGYYVTPISYPTVPKSAARLRLTLTPLHRSEEIKRFVETLSIAIQH